MKPISVQDIKGYNHAVGLLFIFYGLIFIVLGIPLLTGQRALILLAMPGVMLETIILMVIYSIFIVKKYNVEQ